MSPTAYATHVFADVPDDAFYAGPVEWAFDNAITTGKTPTSFAPDDKVTRGESVTFLKRYNDNIFAPAVDQLTDDIDAVEAELSTHGAHTTSHVVVVGTGGVVNNSSYPAVSAIEFATGVDHVDLPGLEVYVRDADTSAGCRRRRSSRRASASREPPCPTTFPSMSSR